MKVLTMPVAHSATQDEQKHLAKHCEQDESDNNMDQGPAPCDDARYVALFSYESEELAQLDVLNLAGCDPALTDWDVEDILGVLEQATLLAELDMSNNQLTDECLQALWCVRVSSLPAQGSRPD